MPLLDVIDVGDEVVCDFCNTGFEDDSVEGGCFIGTYAVCPACTKDIKASDEEEIEYIRGSFRRAVLKKRDGDNTIKIWVE
ncbi:MAG: hypothetical protein GYA36_22645 [Veillonellaceae bacterium]|nr:hypothetical protein [Veillonellaceae bacterium]